MRAGYVASGVVNSLSRRCRLFVVQTSGTLINTGHDIRLILDDPSLHYVNISAGPLSYQYRVSELILHFGVTDSTGSEHTINELSFPAEVRASLVCLLSSTRGLRNATRVPENPGNPPVFKPVNPGLCARNKPGLTV